MPPDSQIIALWIVKKSISMKDIIPPVARSIRVSIIKNVYAALFAVEYAPDFIRRGRTRYIRAVRSRMYVMNTPAITHILVFSSMSSMKTGE